MKKLSVPDETIRRLPKYLRTLLSMKEQKREFVSSNQIAEFTYINPAQIRKDFSYFGAFGTRGTGYEVEHLIKMVKEILKLDSKPKAVLIGAGRIGTAIASYTGFGRYGIEIVAIYDNCPDKIGKKAGDITIKNRSNLSEIKRKNIKLAIIATPPQEAQSITDTLVKAGVTGILNLAPCYLNVPDNVRIRTIDLAMELGMLPYYT